MTSLSIAVRFVCDISIQFLLVHVAKTTFVDSASVRWLKQPKRILNILSDALTVLKTTSSFTMLIWMRKFASTRIPQLKYS